MNGKSVRKPLLGAAAALAVATGVGAYIWTIRERPPILEIYIFSLGSGHSILIRTPEDRRILIDGGGTGEVVRHITSVLPFYSRRIDAIIATADDDTEVTGLIDAVDRYSVDDVYVPALTKSILATTTGGTYRIFLDTLAEKNISVHEVIAGGRILLGNSVLARALFPVILGGFQYSKASAPELVLAISYKSSSIVLLGGVSKKIQTFLATSSIEKANAVIISSAAQPADTSYELIQKLQPTTLIYSRAVSKSSAKKRAADLRSAPSKKKLPPDPWAAVLPENRFNLKEGRSVKITSDGETLRAEFI